MGYDFGDVQAGIWAVMGEDSEKKSDVELVPLENPSGSVPGAGDSTAVADPSVVVDCSEASSEVKSLSVANAEPGNAVKSENNDEASASFAAQDFKAKTTLAQDAFRKSFDFVKDQKILVDAFLVALSFHVIMFPVLWAAGWALPWPKPPVVTTLIDYDLQEWVKNRKPKNIIEFRDPALNQ